VGPKFVPVIVTDAPTDPEVGDTLAMLGVGNTVKFVPLLLFPVVVTTTGPVVATFGTGTAIWELLQLVGVAVVPLKVTVLEPCVRPKVVPVMVTVAPNGPVDGDKPVMFGTTVKFTLLLFMPPTEMTNGPVLEPAGIGTVICVLPQLEGVAAVPLKVVVLLPCVDPK